MGVVTYPDGVVLNDQTYFLKHGCEQNRVRKVVVWINKKKKKFIGLIIHNVVK